MVGAYDVYFLVAALLLFISVVASKITDRLGVPVLLLFLALGMLAGSDGVGGIHFDNPGLAKAISTVALAYILFSGGLETSWEAVRGVFGRGLALATLGVLFTAGLTGLFACAILKLSVLEGLLLGAIVSSTDAAATFAILRSRNIGLKPNIRSLLELESGSNDPMAVFLTIGLLELMLHPGRSPWFLLPDFAWNMGVGGLAGWSMARGGRWLLNHLKLDNDGLYSVLMFAITLLIYAFTTALHGNGFLAVYVAGIVLGKSRFIHKKSLKRFHEGLAWLMQIAMFLILGLQVFPSQLLPVAGSGFWIALFLIFIARPASVFLSLLFFSGTWQEKTMVAWVGLRGAAPIVLATFPLLAGVGQAQFIFNMVFFIVLASVLLQGLSIPWVARALGVDEPLQAKRYVPLDLEETKGIDAKMEDLLIPYESVAVGKAIFELGIPKECLVVLISRNDSFLIPNGSTRLEGGDVIFVLASPEDIKILQKILAQQNNSIDKK